MSVNDILKQKLVAGYQPPSINGLESDIEITKESLKDLSKTFCIKSYKLIIRQSVPIDNVKQLVKAQSYKETHNAYRDLLNSGNLDSYNLSFCPIYIMTFTFENEEYVYYYGKTNSSSKRFIKHKKLEKFLQLNRLPNRRLHLAQVYLDFCYNGKAYTDIPLEWLEFELDTKRAQRINLLNQLKQFHNYPRISKHREIDKIILFIENYLISCFITSGNDRVEFPKSLYNIYTYKNSIDIFYENGDRFVANLSPHTPEDENINEEVSFVGDLYDIDEIEDKIQLFPSLKSEPNKLQLNVLNDTLLCEELPNRDYYSFWKDNSNKSLDSDDVFELWLDDEAE